MDDDFDPYDPPVRGGGSPRRDPFRTMSREWLPSKRDLQGRTRTATVDPPLPLPHSRPSDRALPAARFVPRARGVYEKEADWPGTRAFLVVAEAGHCLMEVTVTASSATDRFVHSLWRFLEREDPRRQLQVL